MTIIQNTGEQIVHRFDNGYGASVVSSAYSYGGDCGLYEIAVLKFDGEAWEINYDTPITDDVLGYLTPEDVQRYLAEIEALPAVTS